MIIIHVRTSSEIHKTGLEARNAILIIEDIDGNIAWQTKRKA